MRKLQLKQSEQDKIQKEQDLQNRAIASSDCPQNTFYHAPTPVPQDSILIRINRCGSVEQTPKEFFIQRDDKYQYNAIHFVTSGKGTLIVGTSEYRLEAGNVFLLNAFEPHRYLSDYEDPMGLIWIEFAGNGVHRLVRYITDSGSYVFRGEADLFTLCADIIMNAQQEAHKTSAQIYEILMELCGKISRPIRKQDYIQQHIQAYIDDNLTNNLSLEYVAKHFGYNPNYFSERFKRMTGTNYNRYVNERKVAQACSMLIITNLSIDQIGTNLGFYDTSHFIKRFEHVIGMSPASYRKCNTWVSPS